jgi:hypothetical protein
LFSTIYSRRQLWLFLHSHPERFSSKRKLWKYCQRDAVALRSQSRRGRRCPLQIRFIKHRVCRILLIQTSLLRRIEMKLPSADPSHLPFLQKPRDLMRRGFRLTLRDERRQFSLRTGCRDPPKTDHIRLETRWQT